MPGLSQPEFERLLADPTKRIAGDIAWTDDAGHPTAQQFRAGIDSDGGWPIWARGWWQPLSKKLTYTIVHAEAGRIFGLDLGSVPHLNPSGEQLIGGHMHIWAETEGDQPAFPRGGVGYSWENPIEVWQIFCAEVNLVHRGRLLPPILRTEMR